MPSLDLMERAGEGLARVTAAVARARADPRRRRQGQQRRRRPGRGAPAARGRPRGRRARGGATRRAARRRARQPRAPPRRAAGAVRRRSASRARARVVDALLGTGFSGAPREPVAVGDRGDQRPGTRRWSPATCPRAWTPRPARSRGRPCAPSRPPPSTPRRSACTCTPGKAHAGRVEVVEIGVPRGAPGAERAGLITERVLDLVPAPRPASGSKFTSGVLVVAGGSLGLTGAPTMAARSAQRAGAGYVQVAVPASVQPAIDLRLLEQMSRGLPDADGFHTPAGVEVVEEMAERAGAVVLGPGLGRAEGAQEFARGVARRVETPLLVDADGLNAHAGPARAAARALGARPCSRPTRASWGACSSARRARSRRTGWRRCARPPSAAAPWCCSRATTRSSRCPGGEVAVSPGGTPALATAGTGDVLSGLIGALLAKGLGPFEAACLGALAHAPGRARRRRAGRRRPRDGGRRDRRAAARPDALVARVSPARVMAGPPARPGAPSTWRRDAQLRRLRG